MVKRLLELFCGNKCVGKVFEANGYEVVSLDFNKKFNPTHAEDILTWDYKQYPSNYFSVIWSSPDCTTFSLACNGKYRNRKNIYGKEGEYLDKALKANQMILRLIEILKYFKCDAWFIENPRALLYHFPPLQEFIKEVNGYNTTAYYGNYNWGFPKPTHIWSNLPLWEKEKPPVMDTSLYRLVNGKKMFTAFDNHKSKRSLIPNGLIERIRLLIPNETLTIPNSVCSVPIPQSVISLL